MLEYIFETVMLWVTATVYGIIVLYGILKDIFRLGFGKVFQWKQFPRPACLDDPNLGTHGYLNLEDVKIHYVASGPEDKPLMLFLHGFPEFWYSWRYQIREFQRDYRVVAIDMRGYGDSDKPKGIDAYNLSKLSSDIKEVIKALGYNSCILVGHDWGGAIAWMIGRRFPEMVDKLITLNCPPLQIFQKVRQANKNQMKLSWYIYLFQLPCLPEFNFKCKNFEFLDVIFGHEGTEMVKFSDAFQTPISQENVDAYKYTFSQPGALTPPLNYYRAFLRRCPANLYDMEYTMPVLLIWGCKDLVLNIATAEIIEKNYPKIEVKRIPEAGHFVQMDTPDQVNSAMREWLDQQRAD